MIRLIMAMSILVMCSGCCELFGVCTSVAVHSSIDSPHTYAELEDFPNAVTQANPPANYAAECPSNIAD